MNAAADDEQAADEILHRRRLNPHHVRDLLALPSAVNPEFGDALDDTMRLLVEQNDARARIITRLRAENRRQSERLAEPPEPHSRAVLRGGRAQAAVLDPFAHPSPLHGRSTAHAAINSARAGFTVAACDPSNLTLDARLLDAYRYDPAQRCRQPACATLFVYADTCHRRDVGERRSRRPPPDPLAEWWLTGDVGAYLDVTDATVSAYRKRGQIIAPDRTLGTRSHMWRPERVIHWDAARPRPGVGGRPADAAP